MAFHEPPPNALEPLMVLFACAATLSASVCCLFITLHHTEVERDGDVVSAGASPAPYLHGWFATMAWCLTAVSLALLLLMSTSRWAAVLTSGATRSRLRSGGVGSLSPRFGAFSVLLVMGVISGALNLTLLRNFGSRGDIDRTGSIVGGGLGYSSTAFSFAALLSSVTAMAALWSGESEGPMHMFSAGKGPVRVRAVGEA